MNVAAAALFGGTAVLALLDLVARTGGEAAPSQWLAGLALALLAAGILSLIFPWQRLGETFQFVPPAIVLLAILISILLADTAATAHAPVGLTLAAGLVLVYLGFVSVPGVPFAATPLVLVVLLAAYQLEPERISLALPLVAVPAMALLAELVSWITEQSRNESERLDRHLEQLTSLDDVLSRFRRPGSLEQAAEQVAVAAREVFEVERTTVVLRDTKGNLINVTLGATTNDEPEPEVAKLIVAAVSSTEPQIIPTAHNGTVMVLPLPAAEAPAGAVLIHPLPADDHDFTLDLGRLFRQSVARDIEHLYVVDELSSLTSVDPLTGIGNRRHAEGLLRALQPGDALILLDLDGFKWVNDTYGHSAGDEVLKNLSDHLRATLRDSDTTARMGGDEFLIVARRAFADPFAVANRVLEGWAEIGSSTTLSAGVALHHTEASSLETFDRADRALLEAKAAGKNQAIMAPDPEPPAELESPEASESAAAEAPEPKDEAP